jgi:arginyl-tRNA synthetase
MARFTPRADPMRELLDAVDAELAGYLRAKFPDVSDVSAFPRATRTKAADCCVQWAQFASKRKMNPAALAQEVATEFQASLDAARGDGGAAPTTTIVSCVAAGVYMNMSLNRPKVFEMALRAVASAGATFGHTDAAKGKRVIIEHTSSNPNAPLHIGNLRNVMIGAHLARLMKACGHDAKEAFYVNDLGAQIGLTALAYTRVYDKLEPYMKIDHWIGAMYAVMNTCQELQQVGVKPGDLEVGICAMSLVRWRVIRSSVRMFVCLFV